MVWPSLTHISTDDVLDCKLRHTETNLLSSAVSEIAVDSQSPAFHRCVFIGHIYSISQSVIAMNAHPANI